MESIDATMDNYLFEKKNIKLWIGIGKELASYFYGLECLSVYI